MSSTEIKRPKRLYPRVRLSRLKFDRLVQKLSSHRRGDKALNRVQATAAAVGMIRFEAAR